MHQKTFPSRRFLLRPVAFAAAFVLIYLLLDWVSYIRAFHGLNITPWNPALALAITSFLRFGRGTLGPWWIALLLGDLLIRRLPVALPSMVILNTSLLAGYAVFAESLGFLLAGRDFLTDRKHLLAWIAISAGGTLLTSLLYVTVAEQVGLLQPEHWMVAVWRFWVGDFVGVAVTMPFFWLLFAHPDRLQRVVGDVHTIGYLSLAVVMLGLAFGFGNDRQLNLFYLLFLPLIWAAAKQGVVGSAVAAFALQTGIVLGVHWFDIGTVEVFELQVLGAALAFSGFFLGMVIDEKERIGSELHQTLRLAAAGEMAAALTHELNQPLTAMSTYGAICEHLLQIGETGEQLAKSINKMISESARAADVVRRLRDFFRTGASQLEHVTVQELISSVETTFADKAARRQIKLTTIDHCGDASLFIDRLQIEVVLRNLVANAFDAVENAQPQTRQITVSASCSPGRERITILVEDSGQGIAKDQTDIVFEAFHTTKANGMGLGLAISRAIAEAHNGTLAAEVSDHGVFRLVLPHATAGKGFGEKR